ncbi:MAG: DNA mismatch repair protein MutS, partial [Cytophagales bacterium]
MEKSRGKGMTPLMQQYEDIKAKYPGTLLLFQVGDFYETFGEDAQQLHQITDIKLTKRSNGSAAAVPLAGFPLHALDAYLPKLIGAGLRVAVCDQTSPPKKGKTLVDRKVRELVTPGLTYNDHLLDKGKNNYLASLHFTKNKIGIAFLDISTGEFLIAEGDESAIIKLVEGFKPAEIIYNKEKKNALQHLLGDDHHCHPLEEWVYNFTYGHKRLNEHFGTTTLKGFGIAGLKAGIVAAGAVLRYLEQAEQLHLHHIIHLGRVEQERYMWLDKFTIRNLELLQPQHEEGVSLIHILDATVTPMGARKLKKWLLLPLKDFYLIEKRLAAVDLFYQDQEMAGALLEMLKEVGDLERLISKVASKRIKPRELAALAKALVQIKHICALLSHHPSPILQDFLAQLHPCDYIVTKIQTTLQEHLPIVFNRGGLIKKGV